MLCMYNSELYLYYLYIYKYVIFIFISISIFIYIYKLCIYTLAEWLAFRGYLGPAAVGSSRRAQVRWSPFATTKICSEGWCHCLSSVVCFVEWFGDVWAGSLMVCFWTEMRIYICTYNYDVIMMYTYGMAMQRERERHRYNALLCVLRASKHHECNASG